MRVLVAATHPQLRWALRTILREEPALIVIGEASTHQDLLSQANALRPDLILLDWDLLDRPKAGALAALRGIDAQFGIIVVSEQLDLREAAGADAYLYKYDPPDQFLAALRGLLAECQVCGPTINSV
jgi:DNA-binding NarL/FixJ family response regulator